MVDTITISDAVDTIVITTQNSAIEVSPVAQAIHVEISAGIGPAGPSQLFFGPTQPETSGQYLWVQTDLPNGGFTLWYEDGLY